MDRTVSIILLVLGIVLIAFGVSAADSLGSDISRFFTGAPTDRAVWLLIAGVVTAVVGVSGLVRGGSQKNY